MRPARRFQIYLEAKIYRATSTRWSLNPKKNKFQKQANDLYGTYIY